MTAWRPPLPLVGAWLALLALLALTVTLAYAPLGALNAVVALAIGTIKAAIVAKKVEEETLEMFRLMASKPDAQLLGETEFQIRDRVHALGAHVIETALNERKKGGIKGRV